ncbi:MAG TPA: peptidoglycan-binding protein [Bauldia sp.]|nr:peptidoglycan-binding protein [Bauldia sp.]
MKSGLPWNLSGVDKETREAVIEAARISGLTVGEWLNQVLGENFAEPDLERPPEPETDEAGEIAAAIERLTQRLGGLEDATRAAIPNLPDRLDQIEHHISRLSKQGGAERKRTMQGISGMVADLARDADNADESARALIEGQRARAGAAARTNDIIAELDQRIAEMRARIAEPQPETPRPLKLDEIRARLNTLLENPAPPPKPQSNTNAQVAAILSALRTLEARVDDAKARVDAVRMAPPPATAEHIERVEQRLADIAAQFAAAEAERKKPKKEAELASAIREISTHQRAIDDRAETLAMRRDQKALSAAMAALRADLGGLTEQVSAISRVGAEQHGAFFEMAQRVETMAQERPLDRSLITAIRGDLETMRNMVEGTARQAQFGALEARHDGFSAQLDGIMRSMPDRAKLEQLGDEVAALRESVEADDSPRAIARLEMRVSEIGRAVEAALAVHNAPKEPDPAVERLENQLNDITARLEGLRDTGAHTAAIHTVEQRLDGRLNEIADRIHGLMAATPDVVETAERRLSGRIDDLAGRFGGGIDDLASRVSGIVSEATRPTTEAIENVQRNLETRLEDIYFRLGGMADTAPQRAAIEHVHERLTAITTRIDQLNASQREPSAALDAIKSEIGALRKEVADKELPAPLSTDHLERQIRDLAKQLDTVTATKDEGPALAALERQVAQLANDLEMTKPRVAALGPIEERLDRMQSLLTENAQESLASARDEARRAVDELATMVANNAVDADIVRGLMRDLESLRSATGGTEETRTRLESVSQTVAQVVDRLAKLEVEANAVSARATGTHGVVAPAAAVAPAAETPKQAWTVAFRGDRTEVKGPGSAAPTIKMEKPAERPMNLFDKKAADRRADFIAAARRAAQAVADEAAAIETPPVAAIAAPEIEEQPKKQGAFQRISDAIRSRKRPLLLAAAAIVLAIGAMQLYAKLTPTKTTALVASVEKVVPAAPAPAPALAPTAVPRDILAEASAARIAVAPPTAAASPPMVAPAPPDAAMAFAEPVPTQNRFQQAAPAAPAADSFDGAAGDAVAIAAPLPVAPSAVPVALAPAPATDNPMTLASAPANIPAATAAPVVADNSGLDPRLGSPKLLNAAAGGDGAAEFEIATRYADGSLVKKDLAEAAHWYTKAAASGVAVAQYRLGSLYERGQGVPKDLTSAVNWYQRAADQGNVNAMHNLAVLMSEGADAAPDHDKALQWFLAAGNYGVRDSQYNLGVIYARGLGVTQDLGESYKWFAIAASQGDTDASARRDEVAKAMQPDDLVKARAAVTAWHVKPAIAEANGVATPPGGWDGPGETVISDGDRQQLVMKIQTLLAEAGYDPGPADGLVGPKTVDAVKAFQHKQGVPETGAIDQTLVASLTQ